MTPASSAATKPIVSWSYSALDMFENCPRKYWAVKIQKLVDDSNQYNRQGDDEHKAFENRLKKGIMLPETLRPLEPMLEQITSIPGEKYFEYQMTLDSNFVPCGWRDWDRAWVRGAADLLIVNGPQAWYFDWKSGKFRPSDEQIELTSLLVFRHFPQVQKINSALVFYRHAKLHPHIVRREDESRLWNGYIGRVRTLEDAKRNDQWPATPNGLCAYCPYKQCQFNKNPNK